MPTYKNVKTGAVVVTASACFGENWEEVAKKPAEKKAAAKNSSAGQKTAAKTQQTKKDVKASE